MIRPKKPGDSIRRVLYSLRPFSESFPLRKDKVLPYQIGKRQYMYLLESGQIKMFRAQDRMLLGQVEAPFILGVAECTLSQGFHIAECCPGASVRRIEYPIARNALDSMNLWRDLFDIIVFLSGYQNYRDQILINRNVYDVVCALLREIDSLPESVRYEISVNDYILSRSGLSRSGVMSVLSELRKGEYIHMENGKFINITRVLPDKF